MMRPIFVSDSGVNNLGFRFYPVRFSFVALEPVLFPAGKSANILRGSFGLTFRRIACRRPLGAKERSKSVEAQRSLRREKFPRTPKARH